MQHSPYFYKIVKKPGKEYPWHKQMNKTQKRVLRDEVRKSHGWLVLLTYAKKLVVFLSEASFEERFGRGI